LRAALLFRPGLVWRNHPLPGERLSARISSFGAGVGVSVAPSWRVRVDAANVVPGAGVQAPSDKRVDFSVGWVY
jgi:hypothetical protein